jgi:hypothetical protein
LRCAGAGVGGVVVLRSRADGAERTQAVGDDGLQAREGVEFGGVVGSSQRRSNR